MWIFRVKIFKSSFSLNRKLQFWRKQLRSSLHTGSAPAQLPINLGKSTSGQLLDVTSIILLSILSCFICTVSIYFDICCFAVTRKCWKLFDTSNGTLPINSIFLNFNTFLQLFLAFSGIGQRPFWVRLFCSKHAVVA